MTEEIYPLDIDEMDIDPQVPNCSKCLSGAVRMWYCKESRGYRNNCWQHRYKEHFHFKCKRCKYEWCTTVKKFQESMEEAR